jgi:hypothetical protein
MLLLGKTMIFLLRKKKVSVLKVWWSLRRAWSWKRRPWGKLSIAWLLSILKGLLLAICGLAVGIRLRWVRCGTCHGPVPRHARGYFF